MKNICVTLVLTAFLLTTILSFAQKPPIMGWRSWNHFHININEQMIRNQPDSLNAKGLYDVGYRFIDIDDGYFGGRDSTGKLFPNV